MIKNKSNIDEKKLVFAILCLGCITISFNVAAIAAAIPTISRGMHLSDIAVSKIIPFYMIPYGVGALLYAPLVKRFTFKQTIMVSMMFYAMASFFCAIGTSLGFLLLARAISGLSGASIIPLGLILIGSTFQKNIRGRMVGLLFSCAFAASLVGILISGLANWRLLFFIPAALGIVMVGCIISFSFEMLNKREDYSLDYVKVFKNKISLQIFIFIFIISLLYHGVHKWLGVYLYRIYNLDQLRISSLFILITIAGALGQNIGGYLADKKGRMKACYLGIVLLSISTMLLCGVFPLIVLAVILIVMSVGWTVGHNGVSTILTDFPDDYRPELASLNSSVRFLSGGIGFFISGFFVRQSFQLTFLGIGLVMLILSFFVRKVIPETLAK